MNDFVGKNYKLAGFDIVQKGTLVDVFAKFCGVDQDPLNLPETQIIKLFRDSEPTKSPCLYPRVSASDIVNALIGNRDIKAQDDQFQLPGNENDLLSDLGAEKMALILVEMRKAKQVYLQTALETFIPAAKIS